MCLSACIIPHHPAPSRLQSATSLFLLGLLLVCGKGLAGWVIMHGLLQSYSRCLQVLQFTEIQSAVVVQPCMLSKRLVGVQCMQHGQGLAVCEQYIHTPGGAFHSTDTCSA